MKGYAPTYSDNGFWRKRSVYWTEVDVLGKRKYVIDGEMRTIYLIKDKDGHITEEEMIYLPLELQE